jgi:hypothetical protein
MLELLIKPLFDLSFFLKIINFIFIAIYII